MSSTSSLSNFIPISKIGEGTFSSVYQVRRVTDQQIYALKKIKIACLKEKQKANALNQIRILASLESNYIISYKEAFFDQKLNLLCIVMEWASQGDLHKKIAEKRERRQRFAEEEIWKAAYQILSGLGTLHRNSILHRDMKSANIFIGDNKYKLGDMNVSKVKDNQQLMAKTQTGTPFYASPEIWRDQSYGSSSDIWSFGCIIYEMCCLKPPFHGADLHDLYKHVQRGVYEPIPRTYSRELSLLIDKCLTNRARERPTAEELLRDNGILRGRCQFYEIEVETRRMPSPSQKLLQTIKVPYDMKNLNSKLPESKYERRSPEGIDNGKTIVKTSQSSYNLSTVQHCKKLLESGSAGKKSQLQRQNDIFGSAAVKSKQSLPDKIKSQLNKINKIVHEKNHKYKAEKQKVLSSVQSSAQNPYSNQHQDYLSPIKEHPSRKQRPLSCNYANFKSKIHEKQAYYISNLKRYNPSVDLMYLSDRKPLANLRQKSQLRSDRRGQLRHQYALEKNKYRCRSANHLKPQPNPDVKHSFEHKYSNNLKPSLRDNFKSDRKGMKLKDHVKSEAVLKQPKQNYSYAMPNSIHSHNYRSPLISKDYSHYTKNEPNYLQEVQNKILSSASSKLRRSDHAPVYKAMESDTRIKRIIKGSNYFCKSSHRL